MSVVEKTRLQYENMKPKVGARILNTQVERLSAAWGEDLNDLHRTIL